jgi:DNA replication and repair protein RecF
MAEYASHIYLMRREYIKRLTVYAAEVMRDISDGSESLTLEYESSISVESCDRNEIRAEYERILASSIDREIAAGVTLFGPHREDIDIKINGISARAFASQGQQRSIVLSLKLAEGEVIKEITGDYPVFLFDDVLSELDDKRRKYVLQGRGTRQIIITACNKGECLGYTECEIEVTGGKYVSSYR